MMCGMVKKKRIGQSAAKPLGDKRKVQRLEKVFLTQEEISTSARHTKCVKI
jgi:hypothetical protein